MTATTTPPRTAPVTAPRAPGPPPDDQPEGRAQGRPGAEIWLTLTTLAVVVGFSRIFTGWDFVGPLATTAVVVHLVLAAIRRRGLGLFSATAISALVFVVLTTWLFFSETTRLGLPTYDTVVAARVALQASWASFHEVVAPTPPQPGFILASCIAVYLAVFLADWAAFRLWVAVEALVPTTILLVFTSLMGPLRAHWFPAGPYALAAMVFVVFHRVARQGLASEWLGARVGRGSGWALRSGAVLAAVAALGGALLGPHLPGAGGGALINWSGKGSGPSSRVTISPLVDIRGRLVSQADTVLFTVTSTARSYWRLTSLDTFDGAIWKSSGRYTSVDGRLPDPLPTGISDPATSGEVEQTFQISALSAIWLPAAFEPVAVNAPDTRVRYQRDSATLIVDTNAATSDGQTYTVRSVLPSFTPQQLRSADTTLPAALAKQDTTLPASLGGEFHRLAVQLTSAQPSAYDKALALQTFFRSSGGFVYDENIPAGHGDTAIADFLRSRRGYCEQFAGTFAAMARSVGLAARVAVGFTTGTQDPTKLDRYVVKGQNAHAWPEVWLGKYGWVPFEPTPGRGAPGAETYTNVPEQQAGNVPGTVATTVPGASTPATTTPPTLDPNALGRALGDLGTAAGGSTANRPAQFTDRLGALGLAALALGVVYLLAVPGLLAARRHHRRSRASGHAGARVRLAWTETAESVALVGSAKTPDETGPQFAARAGGFLGTQQTGLSLLAGLNDAALFGSGQVDGASAVQAEHVRDRVWRAVARDVARWKRIRVWLDIRRLWREPGREAR